MLNRWQAILWTNDNLVYWCISVSLGLDLLIERGLNKIATIFQTTFSLQKKFVLWFQLYGTLFLGSTWQYAPDSIVHGANMGPPGSCRPQMGPMLAPWTLLSGAIMGSGNGLALTKSYGITIPFWDKTFTVNVCICITRSKCHIVA